ncbi:MAG: hypothetical protein ACP5RJ_06420 [Conexivisphaera sp.]
MKKVIREWIPDGQGFDFPPRVIDVIHEMMKDYPNWWGEVNDEADSEFYDQTGEVVEDIWLDERDYEKHYWPDFSVGVGRWAHHEKFHGTWYYYDLDEIRHNFQRALERLKTNKEAEA